MKRILLASFFLPVFAFAYISPGEPRGFVNDFASLFRAETVSQLEAELKSLEAAYGAEVAVVTIGNLGGDSIEDYAVKLFEEWKIGKEREDNGLLLLISSQDREVRIEVGYGLEPVITDIESAHVISQEIVPSFQIGDYDTGVTKAVGRIISDIQNGAPQSSGEPEQNNIPDLTSVIYIFLFVASIVWRAMARSKSWWAGGLLGGVIALGVGIFGTLASGIIASLILVPLGLWLDFHLSKNHKDGDGGPMPPWFMGGGRGGGGFGGFGGGGSGGGGASGRW